VRYAAVEECAMVSSRQQVARIRRLAVRALDSYPLADPELRFIAHGENAAFRVDVTARSGRPSRPRVRY